MSVHAADGSGVRQCTQQRARDDPLSAAGGHAAEREAGSATASTPTASFARAKLNRARMQTIMECRHEQPVCTASQAMPTSPPESTRPPSGEPSKDRDVATRAACSAASFTMLFGLIALLLLR